MSIEQCFETKRIDHLGTVTSICHEIGLSKVINQAVGLSERKVSCGVMAQAMVLNDLGFTSRALYLMPQYLDNRPVDLLNRLVLTLAWSSAGWWYIHHWEIIEKKKLCRAG